jgi:hypothetical protein
MNSAGLALLCQVAIAIALWLIFLYGIGTIG